MNREQQYRTPMWPTYLTIGLAILYYVTVQILFNPTVENIIIAFTIAISGLIVTLLRILYRNEQRRRQL